jgi:ribosome-associated protein
MARNVQEKLKAQGAKILGIEGEQTGEWILVDFGEVIVHIMQPAIRAHYNLEELWTPARVARKRARAETTA